MRHFRDAREIADAMVAEFKSAGAHLVELDGVRFALFRDPDPTAPFALTINVDRLADYIERKLSCLE